MITNLDDPSALDPKRVGAKAAALAQARQAGLPVLPGFVMETSGSLGHLELGAAALTRRGSGGARLAVSSQPVPDAAAIVAAGRQLGPALAVRSSSALEGEGQWAGAFTSYMGITPEELPKAVAGCWASVFSVDALERQRRAGIVPGSVPMAVLVQPSMAPRVGGVAEISDEMLRVVAIAGSPAPLLQGWERGVAATRDSTQTWVGVEAMALIGMETLDEIAAVLGEASRRFRLNRCEWGVADSLLIFQLGRMLRSPPPAGVDVSNPMAAMVMDHGVLHQGVPAAPGFGVGLLHHVAQADGRTPPPRTVISAPTALPQLSQLIWEAAGLVTGRGSPVAHVFEAARSLHVPAVTGVDLESDADLIVAVDGFTGVVAVIPQQPRFPGS